jgi:hypothetical protein
MVCKETPATSVLSPEPLKLMDALDNAAVVGALSVTLPMAFEPAGSELTLTVPLTG